MARLDLVHEATWKQRAIFDAQHGHFTLDAPEDLGGVPVRLFLTPKLLTEAEPTLYRQIVHAARFPGTKLVALTPDAHYGYGVPVGCVILTDRDDEGAVAMGPVGFDIGCGMMSARSDVGADLASPDRKLAFHREVMKRVPMGVGGKTRELGRRELEEIVRGGAQALDADVAADRSRAERDRIPVDDAWSIPWGGAGAPERGLAQLGTLGGGNHFIELQKCEETGTLFVQVHTGSRGFGHGLATNYLAMAKDESGVTVLDLGYFTPRSPHFRDYLNAVGAGGNFAIANRLIIFQAIAEAFRKVFKADLELVYEISHNLVQAESHPVFGDVWVHRKGATRALPGGRPELAGTPWEKDGHPVLIPGSNRDHSYVLRPLVGAARSGYSVNHGAGRRLSRGGVARLRPAEGQRAVPARPHPREPRRRGPARRVERLLQERERGGRRGRLRRPRAGRIPPLAARLAQGHGRAVPRRGQEEPQGDRAPPRSRARPRPPRQAPVSRAKSAA